MSNITPSGSRYFLTFIDDYSRFCVVYILKNKGEVFEKIKEYLEMVENQLNGKVKIIRSDNGGEYISYKVRDLLKSKGIIHQFTVPYCPEQNGVAERKSRSLQEMANCMIIQSKLEKCFWAEAILTSNHLQNRMSTKLIKNKTPYELWFGKKPNLNYLRTFGCRAYAHLPKIKRHKMDTKAKAYRFIGYSEVAKGYRLLDEKDKTVIVSRDVEFIESEYGDECVDQDALIVTFESDYEDVDVIDVNNQDEDNETIDSSDNTKNSYSIENIDPNVSDIFYESNINEDSLEDKNLNDSMEYKISVDSEPSNYKEAIKSNDKRYWESAMMDELNEMKEHQAWDLVPRPIDKNIVTSKWVYKIKVDPTTKAKRYRARLVARGFSQ